MTALIKSLVVILLGLIALSVVFSIAAIAVPNFLTARQAVMVEGMNTYPDPASLPSDPALYLERSIRQGHVRLAWSALVVGLPLVVMGVCVVVLLAGVRQRKASAKNIPGTMEPQMNQLLGQLLNKAEDMEQRLENLETILMQRVR